MQVDRKQRDEGKRCAGGYLIKGSRLCGSSGNRCVDQCAFEYRLRPTMKPRTPAALDPATEAR